MLDIKDWLLLFLIVRIAKCGTMEGKVVGGEYVKITDSPHAVFLYMRCLQPWMCGSSVLNQNVLLTAAHCFLGCNLTYSTDAYAGHENLKQVTVIREVTKRVIHPNYNTESMNGDLALALLNDSLPLGDNIKRIMIMSSSPVGFVTCTVSGWGMVDDTPHKEQGTMKIKMAKQRLRANKECTSLKAEPPGNFCAGMVDATSGRPAPGDSGSGLITSSLQQIGLVSYRIDEYPTVVIYTNVSHYHPWITEQALLSYCDGKWEDLPSP